jgi:hypothetical protein
MLEYSLNIIAACVAILSAAVAVYWWLRTRPNLEKDVQVLREDKSEDYDSVIISNLTAGRRQEDIYIKGLGMAFQWKVINNSKHTYQLDAIEWKTESSFLVITDSPFYREVRKLGSKYIFKDLAELPLRIEPHTFLRIVFFAEARIDPVLGAELLAYQGKTNPKEAYPDPERVALVLDRQSKELKELANSTLGHEIGVRLLETKMLALDVKSNRSNSDGVLTVESRFAPIESIPLRRYLYEHVAREKLEQKNSSRHIDLEFKFRDYGTITKRIFVGENKLWFFGPPTT